MIIIYNQDNGIMAIVTLADDINIHEEAKNFVPKGKRFKIVSKDYLPKEQTYRDAWTIDDSLLTDGIGVMK